MKVTFAIPALDGNIRIETHQSLVATHKVLSKLGIESDEISIANCPYLPVARNTLVSMFLNDVDATDLFFIDADIGFDPVGAVEILKRPEAIVAGIYPLKRLIGGYPVELKTEDNIPVGRDGLIEANFLPTGFMRIKRHVFGKMKEAYPNLAYTDSVVEVRGTDFENGFDYFNMGPDKEKSRYTTEDYAFCQRWRDIGGQCWVYPNIDFVHVGSFLFKGNLHKHLLRQPGGAEDPNRVNAEAVKE